MENTTEYTAIIIILTFLPRPAGMCGPRSLDERRRRAVRYLSAVRPHLTHARTGLLSSYSSTYKYNTKSSGCRVAQREKKNNALLLGIYYKLSSSAAIQLKHCSRSLAAGARGQSSASLSSSSARPGPRRRLVHAVADDDASSL